ncbi:MAG: GIY-YIG nuclease family protein, partial [Smithella sp.]
MMNTKQVPLNESLIKALEQDGNRLYKSLDRQRIRDEALAEDLFGNLDDEAFGEVYNTVLNADRNMRACVYFIKNEYNGFIKIGQTRNLPKRMKEIKSWFLQCGMEPKIKVVAAFITFPQFLNKMEAYYHKFFKERRGYGEWFQIDEAEITDINNF